ncbi:retrovirus-related pol polyprotein from transposon TNT 1-94 [Tanacetum coccineum]
MKENDKEEKVKHEMDEIETINIELEHSVVKLLSENERLHKKIKHLKKIYKDQFDSIKKTCALSKEHSDSLIAQLNSKSMKNANLKCQIQDNVFVITSLKNNLQKLKGKETVENVTQIPIATTIAPGIFKIDLKPLAPRLLNNMEAHIDYLKHTQEQADILWGIVEQAKAKQMLDNSLNFAWTVRFENDQIAKIMGYGDYQLGKIIVSKVYYVEGLRHNLFSVGQFCDADLEVSFRKNTRFIWNLEGVDLLLGSRDTNLYTISLDDMLKTSSICLRSKASKTKSWFWHRRLSYLNFGTLNKLAKDSLARGLPKIKFKKDNLCSACALGKSKKSSHQPKAEDTNQEKLYLLHMDLSGLMHVESINGKKYILLMHDKKLDLSFLHVFGSLCYPTNDSEDLGKLNAKANIGLVPNPIPQQPCNLTKRYDWDCLFQPMFDEYFNAPTIVVSPVPVAAAPRAVDIADSLVSTSIDQDTPSTSILSTQEQEHSPIISQGVEESPKTSHFHDDPLHESLHEYSTSQGSSSNLRPSHPLFELLGRWTKDHPIANVIGDPSRSFSMRKQLKLMPYGVTLMPSKLL